MTEPRLLVVLLNWRTAPMTLRAAAAGLHAMEGVRAALPGARVEMVIVDNDSGDGSFETMHDAAQENGWMADGRVRVLQSGHNGGFGAGNNVGIRAGMSDGGAPDFVYLLNSDAFPEPDAIVALLRALQADPGAGIAGSRIIGEDGVPHETAFRFPSILSEFEDATRIGPVSRLLWRFRVPLPLPAATQHVDWLAGASMMIRREVLERIGVFDETFFLYFEETDLCHRARRAGFATLYVVESRVVHIGSVSTGMKEWGRMPGYWLDSRLHYYSKTHGPFYAACCTLALVLGCGLHRLRPAASRSHAPGFLGDVLRHDVRALGSALRAGASGRGRKAARLSARNLRDMKGKP